MGKKPLPGVPQGAPKGMKVIRNERCEKCKFHQLVPNNVNLVECHEGPPSAFPIMTKHGPATQTVWPVVPKDSWCGKFKPRVEGLS